MGDFAMMEDRSTSEWLSREPEIIPPDRTRREGEWRRQHAWRPYAASQAGATHRVYIARLGPIGTVFLMLMVGILAAIVLFAVLGAVLIWIPVVVLLLAAGAIFRALRR